MEFLLVYQSMIKIKRRATMLEITVKIDIVKISELVGFLANLCSISMFFR